MTATRRAFLFGAAAAALPIPGVAGDGGAVETARKALARFMSAPSLSGDFVQFSPRGPQREGKFSIERPGKARFDYAAPASLTVIADGRTVAVRNAKLGTWDLYPLAKTPMKLLLDDGLDAMSKAVRSAHDDGDLISVVLSDPAVFDRATVEIAFGSTDHILRQWTVTDGRGEETAFVVYGLEFGSKAAPSSYRIPYSDIRTLR